MSLARVCGDQAIAVVLTGFGMDGPRGIEEVRRMGGMAIAQDEASSQVFAIPCAAIDIGKADLVLSLSKVAFALTVLAAALA